MGRVFPDMFGPQLDPHRVWEVDCFRRPPEPQQGATLLWELVLCDRARSFVFRDLCPQSRVSAEWLAGRIQAAAGSDKPLPQQLCAFRPATAQLLQLAGDRLHIPVQLTRHTLALKNWLRDRQRKTPIINPTTRTPYDILKLERPAPAPLPNNLWGDQWRFASLPIGAFVEQLAPRSIPIKKLPSVLHPDNFGLAADVPLPGVIIEAGRSAMVLAQWLMSQSPAAIRYKSGQPDGLILEAKLVDRWILTTFDDEEVGQAGRTHENRKRATHGLHFLLVRPDDSGMTETGLWLLCDAI